jgi:hypothetical protein
MIAAYAAHVPRYRPSRRRCATLVVVLRKAPLAIGLTGGHLLVTETPQLAQTKEQAIRGGEDAVADWIMIVSGYNAQALGDLAATKLASLGLGAAQHDIYQLSYTATPRNLRPQPLT